LASIKPLGRASIVDGAFESLEARKNKAVRAVGGIVLVPHSSKVDRFATIFNHNRSEA
jgi:hypothetical protein